MKQNFLKWMVCMCFGLLSVATVMAGGNYKTVKVKAPFPMQPIKVFIYPDRDFTWIIWPVAGVLFAAVSGIFRAVMQNEKKKIE